MRAARRKPWLGTTQLALLLAAGCSLQNFDYLQQSSGGSSSGGTSSTAGNSGGGTETNGGEPSTAGTGNSTAGGTTSGSGTGAAAGSEDTGGSGGSTSGGKGGSSGSGGKGGNGGSGATGELVNGSFETNTTIGWTIKPATTYAFTQTPKGTATTPDGTYQFATWSDDKPFAIDLSQTISGLEDGLYVFKGYFNLGPGVASFNVVEAYATKCGGTDPDPVGIQPAGDSTWLPVSVEGIEVTGGSCTVGVRIDWNAKAWLNADLFTFERVSDLGAGGAGGQGGSN